MNTPWTGRLTTSPKVLRAGHELQVSVVLLDGAVTATKPAGVHGCKSKTETREGEVQKKGQWMVGDVDVPVETTCKLRLGTTNHTWAFVNAGVTGPCGSHIAVQERRAEFAACGQATANDYYGVIGKEAAVLKGTVHLGSEKGPGARGVPIAFRDASGVRQTRTLWDGSCHTEVEEGAVTVNPVAVEEDTTFRAESRAVTEKAGKDVVADVVMEADELSGSVRSRRLGERSPLCAGDEASRRCRRLSYAITACRL